MNISLFSIFETFDMTQSVNQYVTKRSWQCLQTKNERENVEKEMRIEKEKNRKIRENDMRIECFIETWIDANVSNLIDFETDEIVAWKYDVMRFCMKLNLQLFLELHLSKLRKNNDFFWLDCKSNEFDFSTNMRNKSFTMK